MPSFRGTYQGFPLDLPVEEAAVSLRGGLGRWPGQTPSETVNLVISVQSPRFFFNPNNADTAADDDEFAAWLSPHLLTEWLDLPAKTFPTCSFRDLDGLRVDFAGLWTPNALTKEDWFETPGLVTFYGQEGFRSARIALDHRGGGVFAVQAEGETELDSRFDVAFEAPLSIDLAAHRGHTAEEVLAWLGGFVDVGDFDLATKTYDDSVYVSGAVKANG
ncbi:hypothetical protein JOD31_002178 [Methylopila capsulata]|uniref:Uncharacterized protein n=1 Tax=Methylopila capsulata TaxID=61654 RepID=A0A9W6MR89_9HYPH|nr:hypothetical protein [Methylopila capsulata]MBM7851953.1 hypothetical protein [Methylopila capsulata]GLK55018.1 hypothetical protein GCM10008170_10370 [Methylopila capsulata]